VLYRNVVSGTTDDLFETWFCSCRSRNRGLVIGPTAGATLGRVVNLDGDHALGVGIRERIEQDVLDGAEDSGAEPMPSASVRMARRANPGCFRSPRSRRPSPAESSALFILFWPQTGLVRHRRTNSGFVPRISAHDYAGLKVQNGALDLILVLGARAGDFGRRFVELRLISSTIDPRPRS